MNMWSLWGHGCYNNFHSRLVSVFIFIQTQKQTCENHVYLESFRRLSSLPKCLSFCAWNVFLWFSITELERAYMGNTSGFLKKKTEFSIKTVTARLSQVSGNAVMWKTAISNVRPLTIKTTSCMKLSDTKRNSAFSQITLGHSHWYPPSISVKSNLLVIYYSLKKEKSALWW